MANLIDIYAVLPENVSCLECFKQSHICFIGCFNNPTEITRNHCCGVFFKNPKYLREMFLRFFRDVTEYKSFLRYAQDVLKMSRIKHRFEMFLRRIKDVTKKLSLLRCFWEVSGISLLMEFWLRSLWDTSCRLEWSDAQHIC